MRKAAVLLLLIAIVAFVPGCRRSRGDVWEDSKSCGHHMRRGLARLGGKHAQEAAAVPHQHFARDNGSDFIPLHDEDLVNEIIIGQINADTAIPQSGLIVGRDLPGIEGFHNPQGELARIFEKIHFDTDDYTIRGEENLRYTKQIADYLKKHPQVFVFIEGHCDERGAAAYNLALGARRSNSVRNYLIKHGANLDQLFTVSYGKEKPLAKGHNSKSWGENRRAQFKLYERS